MRITKLLVFCFFVMTVITSMVFADGWKTTSNPDRVTTGFRIPESIVKDPATGLMYVSNIGSGTDFWLDDANGFISRLNADGSVQRFKWQKATKDAPLNSPKGLCILKGRLYVADNNSLHWFALDGSASTSRVIPGARQLNDLATDGKFIYASDSAGNVFWKVNQDLSGEKIFCEFFSPNGITFWKNKVFAVSWDGHDIFELDPTGKTEPRAFGLADKFTNLDGIEVLNDGTIIVTDFFGNKICAVSQDGKTVTTLAEVKDVADLGLCRKTNTIMVPQFFERQVVFFKLSK